MGYGYMFRNVNKFNELKRIMFEILYAEKYHDAIPGCEWMPKEGLSIYPSGWAVGYPYLYLVFRILNDIRPKSILECGLGQSSRLINRYFSHNNGEVKYVIVEQDENWVDLMKEEIGAEIIRTDVYNTQNVYRDITQRAAAEKYKDFKELLEGRKFDFISIDGPHGDAYHDKYSRMDLLDILPGCLEKDFLIVFDDFDRKGEQNTCKLIRKILDENGIKYFSTTFRGAKPIALIASQSYFFMRYI